MINFIKKANEEYLNNGYSDRFVKMENKILEKGSSIQVYYFARYVRGANIKKFQKYMLQNASYDIIFYYLKHVKGANASQFIVKAGEEGEMFWARKYTEVGRSRRHEGITRATKILADEGIEVQTSTGLGNMEMMIYTANKAFEKYGRNEEFVNIEKEIVYNMTNGDKVIFARQVPGIDVALFEKDAVLTADPLNIYLLALEVSKTSIPVLFRGLEMAKLDYARIDEDLARREGDIKTINHAIENCDEADVAKRKQLESKRELIKNNLTYIERLSDYEYRLRTLALERK